MYSYEELEKIYYKRKFQKIAIFVSISLMFIVGSYLVIKSENKKSEKGITLNKSEKKNLKEEKITKSPQKEEELVLTFMLPDIQSIETEKLKNNSNNNVNSSKKVVTSDKNISKPEVGQKSEEVKKTRPLIIIKTQKLTLKDLLESYQSFPTFDKAVQIADIYLKKGNLEESKQWALKANNIDPSNYKTWIIFAKILIKQNKRKDAIKVLKTYIENYGSNSQIENFIRSIK